jgi:hypothetical protein
MLAEGQEINNAAASIAAGIFTTEVKATLLSSRNLRRFGVALSSRKIDFGGGFVKLRIPPTAVGGSVQILSTRNLTLSWNPTNGSWWMVQILSGGSEVSTHCRGWDYIGFRRGL